MTDSFDPGNEDDLEQMMKEAEQNAFRDHMTENLAQAVEELRPTIAYVLGVYQMYVDAGFTSEHAMELAVAICSSTFRGKG